MKNDTQKVYKYLNTIKEAIEGLQTNINNGLPTSEFKSILKPLIKHYYENDPEEPIDV